MAQLSKWWTGSWIEKTKQTIIPKALSPTHHAVSATLTLGLDPAAYGKKKDTQKINRNTRPPIVMYPNPLYTPSPGQQI